MLAEQITEETETLYNGENSMSVQEIPLNKIALSKNSRMAISDGDLSELMASIKSVGLLQPIGVIKNGTGYRVCYGNRRFLAASKLGMKKIPAIVQVDRDAHDADIKNLTENIQRRNISLAEVGRYIDILSKQGLTGKECAARLGVTPNYVENCRTAFQHIPNEYRNDIEMSVKGRKVQPGKIPMKTVTAILNAEKTHRLTQIHVKDLFKSAKTHEKFTAENVNKYAAQLKAGNKDYLSSVKPIRQVVMKFMMNQSEYDRLEIEFINDGPFNSMTALFTAVLRGQKHIKINLKDC